jgi:DNA-binding response OmpR family regulator
MRILLVEDDEAIAAVITDFLTSQHYVLDVAYDGQEGWDLIEVYTYDLIVLDVMLPKMDGMTLCRRLRSQGHQMPVLLLTSRHTSTDKVMGLDVGADDYVVKPFDLKELGARIRALLRRGNAAATPILEWGKLQLDPSNCEVTYDAQPLHLSPKEYSLLELFLRNSSRILSRRAILNHLWSWEDTPGEDTVKAHIKGLRQKFKSVGAPTDIVETVYGMGYRLKPLCDEQKQNLPQIVVAGVSESLASWLQQRLGAVSVQNPSGS